MGIYINPKDKSKEEWLHNNAVKEHSFLTSSSIKWEEIPENCLPVCLVDNGLFTAAGVAYSENEFDMFNDPSDRRFKLWYIVKIENLVEVLPPKDGDFLLRNQLLRIS